MTTEAAPLSAAPGLDFEQPLLEIDASRRALEQITNRSQAQDDELRQLRRELAERTRQVYANLTPWQIVQVARHKDRPYTSDYLSLAFEEFVELHGDRRYGDDRAIRTGFARLDRHKVLVVGHQKGRTYKERSAFYFGCAHPEGYRKAILKMKLAEKYGLPVICLIDTPGAYPGIGAEERGQSQAIAENMYEMSRLRTPIICLVIG
jgi:acetyl-CoA carboxylase carboxyl transferase subunit alpha